MRRDHVSTSLLDPSSTDDTHPRASGPLCRTALREDQLFLTALFEPSAMELRAMREEIKRARKRQKKKKRNLLDDDSDDDLPDLDWWQSAPKAKGKKEKKPKREKSRFVKVRSFQIHIFDLDLHVPP